MTIRFKGHHADKILITHKEKGYGLQTYYICKKGYKYKIFMCNDHSPKTYLSKRMLTLHSRVMALFDIVKEKHHQRAMDNI